MNSRLLLILVPLLATQTSPALQLRSYQASRHNRFSNFPAAPVANPAFLHSALDLTGVGWDPTYAQRQMTLISPQHFVMANHFRPPVGGEVKFLSGSGAVRTATVHSLITIPNASGQATDVLIGRLTAPMPAESGVSFLPCHLLDTETSYLGLTLGVLGQPARGGRGVIQSFADFGGDPVTGASGINTTRTMHFSFSTLTGNADDAYAESGDSGSPSFVVVNGKAAVVGTHTAVLSAVGTITTIDSFLPAYRTQVNAVMEADGYHLTAAAPKSATLTLTQSVTPATARAGYPVTLQFTVTNTGAANPANNIKLSATFNGTAATVTSASGTGWITETSGTAVAARRGGLNPQAAAPLSLTFTPSAPGNMERTVRWSADETPGTTATASLTVLPSFKSWAGALTDKSAGGDDDGDGADNLVEYACGGDPAVASLKVRGSSADILLTAVRFDAASGREIVRFPRYTNAAERALEYHVETSASPAGPWTDVTAQSVPVSTTPLTSGMEQVDLALPSTGAARQFARLRVTLGE